MGFTGTEGQNETQRVIMDYFCLILYLQMSLSTDLRGKQALKTFCRNRKTAIE